MIGLLKRKIKKSIGLTLCIMTLLSVIPATELNANAANSEKDKIIVSMGDSYSSGEGIDNFYDYDLPIADRVKSKDWLAHRSKKSWGGQLVLPGVDGVMSDEKNRNKHWYFVAASGAETKHIDGEQTKKYYKKELAKEEKEESLPPQLDIFDQLKKERKTADYVTITIGGNDVGFSEIITKAALPWESSYLNPNAFSDLVDMIMEPIRDDKITNTLAKTYKKIHDKSKAKIIVAGYPKLLEQSGKGALFNKHEATLINDAVHIFNMKINLAVLQCVIDEKDSDIYHFVPVEDGFNTHEAYSDDPYINKIETSAKKQDIDDRNPSAYSMHPNEKGAEIYRACVQEKINELERTTSDERDIVLVLDVSGSMSGKPMEETKKASSKFINTILKEDASIGIVTYDSSASMVSDFSDSKKSLQQVVDNISGGGSTNIEDGLAQAEEMLSKSKAKKKIIVLMSDGEPNQGKVGDELISYADSIKDDDTYIYTLGFFSNIGSSKSAAQILMEKIASDGCHYEVDSADDLVFFFEDIADQINGQKYIYVRIACPVDVKVRHQGETLRSEEKDMTTRTSFGSLTFEENDNEAEDGTDNRVKILRLKEGPDYKIQIDGNGKGKMNYTIGFMDEAGEYSDIRKFKNIKISKHTQIDTVAKNAPSTTLKVDTDGDGKYDLKYKAKANGVGKVVDYSYIFYIAGGVIILAAFLFIYFKLKKRRKAKHLR